MVTPLPSPRGGEERPVDRRVVRSISFSACFLRQVLRRFAHLERLTAFVDGQQIGDAKLGTRNSGRNSGTDGTFPNF